MQGYWLRTDRNLSVSSHLTPDPERRLGRMLETLRQKRNMADFKLAAAAAISAVEMFAVMPSHAGAEVFLSLAMLAALAGLSELMDKAGEIKYLDRTDSSLPDDYIIDEKDLIRYSRSELVNFLDKYLGGGISSTPYYEDLVSRISYTARSVVRKKRMFSVCCILITLAQIVACISFFM